MTRRQKVKLDPMLRFHGLGGSLVNRDLFTNKELEAMVHDARRDPGPGGVWDKALSTLITEANLRLANRSGTQYGSKKPNGTFRES